MQTVAVVGLGYVGLLLAVEFGKVRPTIGYDRSAAQVAELARGHDHTGEPAGEEIAAAGELRVTADATLLGQAGFIIVAMPTPVDTARRPDFGPLEAASETVGRYMKCVMNTGSNSRFGTLCR